MTTEGIYTGVCGQNDIDMDWLVPLLDAGIDLDLLAYKREHRRPPPDMWESHGRVLLGDWKKTREYSNPERTRWTMKWGADTAKKDGEGFAAIYNQDTYTIQVVWSRWTQYGEPASPCYPDQNCLLTSGISKTYSLPPDAFNEWSLAEWGGEIKEYGL